MKRRHAEIIREVGTVEGNRDIYIFSNVGAEHLPIKLKEKKFIHTNVITGFDW